MLNKLFLLLCLIPCIAVGMDTWMLEELSAPVEQQESTWTAPNTVHVYTLTQHLTFPIAGRNLITNISDLKDVLRDSEGIPTDQQALYPRIITPYFFDLLSNHKTINQESDGNVQEIMKQHKTDSFSLMLKLRQR